MMLSREERDVIQARADAAAPGPWSEECVYGAIRHVDRNVDHDMYCECGRRPESKMFGRYDGPFIAHSRTDIPALLDHANSADKVIEGLVGALERCVGDLSWAEEASVGTNFRSSILLAQAALAAAGRKRP